MIRSQNTSFSDLGDPHHDGLGPENQVEYTINYWKRWAFTLAWIWTAVLPVGVIVIGAILAYRKAFFEAAILGGILASGFTAMSIATLLDVIEEKRRRGD